MLPSVSQAARSFVEVCGLRRASESGPREQRARPAFELHKATLGEYVEQTWGWDEADQRRIFTDAFDRQPRQIIEVAGTDVGVLGVEERPDEVYLGLVELLPAWQNKGLGTDILRWLLRRAHESRRPLSLSVLKTNPRAAALYEREGLRVVGSEPAKLLMRSAP